MVNTSASDLVKVKFYNIFIISYTKGMACLRIELVSQTKITAIYQFRIYLHHFLVMMQRIFP